MMKNEFDESGIVQIPIWSLKTSEPFKSLFPIRESVLSEMIDDMSLHGFDAGHPIVVWNMTVVDGHTRLRAADVAGLEHIPVICRQFENEDEALDYAIRSQRNRRNLTDGELLQCIRQLDIRKKAGRPVSGCGCTQHGKSAEIVGNTLGISRSQVERLRAIAKYASAEQKTEIIQGKCSITCTYHEIMRTRRPVSRLEPDADAELIHSVMADIHARLNEAQIRKLVKKLQIELATT